MKLITTSILFILLFLHGNAKIWRVNNNPGIIADFTTLQAAHNGALSGDTIHLEPSPITYGALNANKKLIIIGPGHSLSTNNNLQYTSVTSKTDEIIFEIGSENSVLTGVTTTSFDIFIKTSNISIIRNRLSGIYLAPSSTVSSGPYSISATYIRENWVSVILEYNPTNIAFNIAGTSISANIINTISLTTPAIITSNYIGSLTCKNSTVVNNIIKLNNTNCSNDACNLFQVTFNNTINNNVFTDVANPGNQGNYQNGQNNIFNPGLVNVIVGTANNSESDYQLLTNSVAVGAGTGGINVGPFGGGYTLSGIPSVPTIYNLQVEPTGSSSNGLNVTVKSRTN